LIRARESGGIPPPVGAVAEALTKIDPEPADRAGKFKAADVTLPAATVAIPGGDTDVLDGTLFVGCAVGVGVGFPPPPDGMVEVPPPPPPQATISESAAIATEDVSIGERMKRPFSHLLETPLREALDL
jgi:hypothetical protein